MNPVREPVPRTRPLQPFSMRTLPLAALLLAVVAASAGAQQPGQGPPPRAENLKVLPKDIPRDSLIQAMRAISLSLGVRCTYCHVSTDSAGVERFQFARDDKPAKDKARAMMRMTARINGELLPEVPGRRTPAVAVTCVTCHRSAPLPLTLAQAMDTVMVGRGRDSAVAYYRRLKAEEGNRGKWDFGEPSLNEYARVLAERGRDADALAVLELNAAEYPSSAAVDMQMGDVHRKMGDRDKALARYRAALTKQPNNQQARRRIAELEGPAR
jgi:hypothetical protein